MTGRVSTTIGCACACGQRGRASRKGWGTSLENTSSFVRTLTARYAIIYDGGDSLLMVASDRISAFDFILPDEIPHKGEILTRISAFWFSRFADLMPNHMVSLDVADFPDEYQRYADYLTGRARLVKKARTIPIECIVRGYLTVSGKKTYGRRRHRLRHQAPGGSRRGIAASRADLHAVHQGGPRQSRREHLVRALRRNRRRGHGHAAARCVTLHLQGCGCVCRDAWNRHCRHQVRVCIIDNQLTLIDECLTPDSSRFLPADGYEPGRVQPSYDKQYVRDWLAANWDMKGEAPHLPQEVIDGTSRRYQEAFQIITGSEFKPMKEN